MHVDELVKMNRWGCDVNAISISFFRACFRWASRFAFQTARQRF